jgi:hypothetical protein
MTPEEWFVYVDYTIFDRLYAAISPNGRTLASTVPIAHGHRHTEYINAVEQHGRVMTKAATEIHEILQHVRRVTQLHKNVLSRITAASAVAVEGPSRLLVDNTTYKTRHADTCKLAWELCNFSNKLYNELSGHCNKHPSEFYATLERTLSHDRISREATLLSNICERLKQLPLGKT